MRGSCRRTRSLRSRRAGARALTIRTSQSLGSLARLRGRGRSGARTVTVTGRLSAVGGLTVRVRALGNMMGALRAEEGGLHHRSLQLGLAAQPAGATKSNCTKGMRLLRGGRRTMHDLTIRQTSASNANKGGFVPGGLRARSNGRASCQILLRRRREGVGRDKSGMEHEAGVSRSVRLRRKNRAPFAQRT